MVIYYPYWSFSGFLIFFPQGNKVEEAKAIVANSGMKIFSNDNLDEAAQLVTTLSKVMEVAEQGNVKVNFELPI